MIVLIIVLAFRSFATPAFLSWAWDSIVVDPTRDDIICSISEMAENVVDEFVLAGDQWTASRQLRYAESAEEEVCPFLSCVMRFVSVLVGFC